ncbi:hypothetical protein SFJ1713_2640 [Shigella flexneri SFJ17B]|nr:hypothetical protein SFJ1713_2640 [Shigella flexneri SFJ17B]
MTTTHIRGYIPHAPAKSGVGIGTPDIETVHTALAVFYALSTVTFAIYGGLCGGTERCAGCFDR